MQNELEAHDTLTNVILNVCAPVDSSVPPSHVPPEYLNTLLLSSIAMQNTDDGHETDSIPMLPSMSATEPKLPLL